jgi:hypothetical protein
VVTCVTMSVVTLFCQFTNPSPTAMRLFVYTQGKFVVLRTTRATINGGRAVRASFRASRL